jgi:hypothetical protein
MRSRQLAVADGSRVRLSSSRKRLPRSHPLSVQALPDSLHGALRWGDTAEIEVRPAQAHDLSPAEPHGDGEQEGRVERVLAGGSEEVERLVKARARRERAPPLRRARRLRA